MFSRSSNPGMKPSTPPNKMCIIHRRNNTHNPRTPRIDMAKVITQCLNIVDGKFILINQDGIMSRTRSALQPRMGKQKVVVELRVNNVAVHDGTSGTIASAVRVATVDGEEASVVTFRDDNEGDVGTVSLLESFAGGADGFDFCFDDVRELTFGDSVAEEQDTFGFGFGLLVECLIVRS